MLCKEKCFRQREWQLQGAEGIESLAYLRNKKRPYDVVSVEQMKKRMMRDKVEKWVETR